MTATATAQTPILSVDDQVLKLVSELCSVRLAEIRPEHELRADLGMDSVSSMELLSVIAEHFDVDIELEEAVSVQTVAGLLELAREKIGDVG